MFGFATKDRRRNEWNSRFIDFKRAQIVITHAERWENTRSLQSHKITELSVWCKLYSSKALILSPAILFSQGRNYKKVCNTKQIVEKKIGPIIRWTNSGSLMLSWRKHYQTVWYSYSNLFTESTSAICSVVISTFVKNFCLLCQNVLTFLWLYSSPGLYRIIEHLCMSDALACKANELWVKDIQAKQRPIYC